MIIVHYVKSMFHNMTYMLSHMNPDHSEYGYARYIPCNE